MPDLIIGLAGRAAVGKSTAAEILCRRLGFEHVAFADPIKGFCRAVMRNWGPEHFFGLEKEVYDVRVGQSPRHAFQSVGDYGRELDAGLWLSLVDGRLRESSSQRVVVSDVRMDAEADYVRERGVLVHVVREQAKPVRGHPSERGVKFAPGDALVLNNGTLSDLEIRLNDIVTANLRAAA